MLAVFPDGKPLKINREDFRREFLSQFPKLISSDTDSVIDTAIDSVYDMFSGVATLWDMHEPQVWFDKTRRCYLMLTAWYIGDVFPKYIAGSGVPVMGAIPIKEKKIGGVTVKFDTDYLSSGSGNYLNLLKGLLSNPWGKQAYMMITCSVKRTALL